MEKLTLMEILKDPRIKNCCDFMAIRHIECSIVMYIVIKNTQSQSKEFPEIINYEKFRSVMFDAKQPIIYDSEYVDIEEFRGYIESHLSGREYIKNIFMKFCTDMKACAKTDNVFDEDGIYNKINQCIAEVLDFRIEPLSSSYGCGGSNIISKINASMTLGVIRHNPDVNDGIIRSIIKQRKNYKNEIFIQNEKTDKEMAKENEEQ